MKKHSIYALLSAYGYEKQLDDLEHCRTRFKHDETGFVDLWIGRKRITAGLYDSNLKIIRYRRIHKMEDLEDLLESD